MAILPLVVLSMMIDSGCRRTSPPVATVEGTLTQAGKPLENCLVTFLPVPGPDQRGPHSRGVTDREGRYQLSWDDQQRGASVGWHRVTIQDLSVTTGVRRRDHGAVDADLPEDAPPPAVRPSRVPEDYSSAGKTPLKEEVRAGHQVIDLTLP